ncbi:MAG: GAF domain-containing protein [Hyphomicrobiales bacterium]
MPKDKQPLTVADIAAILEIEARRHAPEEVYAAVDRLAQRVLGHRLFTVMRQIAGAAEVERTYSSNTKAYPVGGRKQKQGTAWGEKVLDRGEVFIAPDADALRATFADHELIFSLGIGSIMNVPISHGGRVLATMNVSGEAGQYRDADIPTAKVLGGLLAPVLLTSARD